MDSTPKGPVVMGWDTLQEQQTGFDVAGGEHAGGGQVLTSSLHRPPHLGAQSECLQSGKQEALHRTGSGMARGVGAGMLVQDSVGPERMKVPEPSPLMPQTAEQPSGPSTGLLSEFRARSPGRDDPEGSGQSPHGHHVKGLRVGGWPWPRKSSGLPGGAGKDRFPSQEEGRVSRHMPGGSTGGRVWAVT